MRKNIIIVSITAFLLILISVAYAAFSSVLIISGSAAVNKDNVAPTCGAWYLRDSNLTIQEAYDQNKFINPGTNTTWTNTDKKLFIECTDNMPGSYGCINVTEITDGNDNKRYYKEVKEYTTSVQTDPSVVTVTLKDAYLNETVCTLPIGGSNPYIDKQAPVVTITPTSYNKFTYSATDDIGVTGYQVTNSSSTPSTWISTPAEVTIDNATAKTYYVWAKDGVNTSNETINTYLLTKSEETGSTLTLKYNNSSGTELSKGYVLGGTNVYAHLSPKPGYKEVSMCYSETGSSTINCINAARDYSITEIYTINNNADIWTSAKPNTYSVTLDNQGATSAGTSNVWYKYNTVTSGCYYYTNTAATACLNDSTIVKPEKSGYIFGGYYSEPNGAGTNYVTANGVFTNDLYQKLPSEIDSSYSNNIKLYAKWNAKTDTPYVVNHYVHDIGTNTYTLVSTDNLTGTTGATLTLANLKDTIAGATYVDGYLTGDTVKPTSGAVTTTTIAGDGSTVINLYYRRNYLYVQYDMNTGSLSQNHGEAIGYIGSLITSTNNTTPTNFLMGVYGGYVNTKFDETTYTASTSGLHNYNSPTNINIEKSGYIGRSSREWNTLADGTGTSYSQNVSTYNANGFAGADLSTGDQVVTLYVNWIPQNYTITYALNHGTNSINNPSSYNIESSAIALEAPTKTLTFVGNTNDDPASNATNADNVSIGSSTSKAQTFAGWTGSNGSTAQVSVTIPAGSTGNKSYTAHWTAVAGTLPIVSKTGYSCGWSTSSTGTTTEYSSGGTFPASDITEDMDSTVNLYAVCTPTTYTISYEMNNGNNPNPEPSTATYDADVAIGTTSGALKTITITGDANNTGATVGTATVNVQTFTGWTSSSAAGLGSNAVTGATTSSYLSWNGSLTTNEYFKNLRDSSGIVTLTANWSGTATLPTISKSGFTCKWYSDPTDGTEIGTSGSSITPSMDASTSMTVYARCSENVYTISLDNQSGDIAGTASIYEKYNDGYYLSYTAGVVSDKMTTSTNGITIPTKTGYVFAGYYTEPNGAGTQYIDSNGFITLSASTTAFSNAGTLYAKWTDNVAPYASLTVTPGLGSFSLSLSAQDPTSGIASIVYHYKKCGGTETTFSPGDNGSDIFVVNTKEAINIGAVAPSTTTCLTAGWGEYIAWVVVTDAAGNSTTAYAVVDDEDIPTVGYNSGYTDGKFKLLPPDAAHITVSFSSTVSSCTNVECALDELRAKYGLTQ